VYKRQVPDRDKIHAFLTAIPESYKFIEICLNSTNEVSNGQFQVFSNKTFELDLTGSYEEVYRHYSDNTKRNLKKAVDHNVTILREERLEDLITMFRSNQGRSYPKIKSYHYSRLNVIMVEGIQRETGKTYIARDAGGSICAGAYFIHSNRRYVFLFSGNTPESRENGAMFLLIDRFIRDHSGETNLLDFMGSNRESLARFYTGFGAREVRYPGIKRNRLPWLVRWVKA